MLCLKNITEQDMNRDKKPKLTASQLIQKLKDNGVTFNYITEEEAYIILCERNNYMRIASYRKNYPKNKLGVNKDKYDKLDFAYLYELSILDMHLRYLILKMCLDIEHMLKVHLLNLIEKDNNENGYDIVCDFLKDNQTIVTNIEQSSRSPFVGDLTDHYFTITHANKHGVPCNKIQSYDDCPAWVLVEVVSFGNLIKFYYYYCKRSGIQEEIPHQLINLTKSLRNACAHNNCILSDLSKGTSNVPPYISQILSEITTITKNQRRKKTSCRVILEFVAMLCLYDLLVTDDIKKNRLSELRDLFFGRFVQHCNYFKGNDLIISSYVFVCKVLCGLFRNI